MFLADTLAVGQQIKLTKEASKYVGRVLRRSTGDPVILFNGDGFNYHSTLSISDSSVEATIQKKEKNVTESPLNITLVQSLAKGTKLDLIIQKATELGVTHIVPVSSEHSVLQIDKRKVERKMEHWRGIAVSASSQCQRSIVPVIEPPCSFTTWLKSVTDPANLLLLHPAADKPLKQINLHASDCTIIVGPEGGFSAEELVATETLGVTRFHCGPRILRTETAGFTAIAILQSMYGDL